MNEWHRMAVCGMVAAVTIGVRAGAHEVPALVSQQLPGLVATYKGIHAAPELSHHEAKTSALLAGEMRKAGFTVTERVAGIPMGRRRMGWWEF